jgi:hypothetical protein
MCTWPRLFRCDCQRVPRNHVVNVNEKMFFHQQPLTACKRHLALIAELEIGAVGNDFSKRIRAIVLLVNVGGCRSNSCFNGVPPPPQQQDGFCGRGGYTTRRRNRGGLPPLRRSSKRNQPGRGIPPPSAAAAGYGPGGVHPSQHMSTFVRVGDM